MIKDSEKHIITDAIAAQEYFLSNPKSYLVSEEEYERVRSKYKSFREVMDDIGLNVSERIERFINDYVEQLYVLAFGVDYEIQRGICNRESDRCILQDSPRSCDSCQFFTRFKHSSELYTAEKNEQLIKILSKRFGAFLLETDFDEDEKEYSEVHIGAWTFIGSGPRQAVAKATIMLWDSMDYGTQLKIKSLLKKFEDLLEEKEK